MKMEEGVEGKRKREKKKRKMTERGDVRLRKMNR